jgi:hypothetical protein
VRQQHFSAVISSVCGNGRGLSGHCVAVVSVCAPFISLTSGLVTFAALCNVCVCARTLRARTRPPLVLCVFLIALFFVRHAGRPARLPNEKVDSTCLPTRPAAIVHVLSPPANWWSLRLSQATKNLTPKTHTPGTRKMTKTSCAPDTYTHAVTVLLLMLYGRGGCLSLG